MKTISCPIGVVNPTAPDTLVPTEQLRFVFRVPEDWIEQQSSVDGSHDFKSQRGDLTLLIFIIPSSKPVADQTTFVEDMRAEIGFLYGNVSIPIQQLPNRNILARHQKKGFLPFSRKRHHIWHLYILASPTHVCHAKFQYTVRGKNSAIDADVRLLDQEIQNAAIQMHDG
jgi:hypothetical protein